MQMRDPGRLEETRRAVRPERGDPIMTVTALGADHIIGYLRQPITVGMTVEVLARFFDRPAGRGTIVQVGTQPEAINPMLLTAPVSSAPVPGLPIEISLPNGLRLSPGEIVDLAL